MITYVDQAFPGLGRELSLRDNGVPLRWPEIRSIDHDVGNIESVREVKLLDFDKVEGESKIRKRRFNRSKKLKMIIPIHTTNCSLHERFKNGLNEEIVLENFDAESFYSEYYSNIPGRNDPTMNEVST